MRSATKPFASLTAADLMTPDVTAIPRHLSLRSAARMLAQARVSGAPVIDGTGTCVGVISATDFVHWAKGGPHRRLPEQPECVCADWQVIESEELPAEEVGSFMTADPVTAGLATKIGDLARMMLDAHIHRIIIVDEDRHPIGVVSSTDVLAAVAAAAESRS